MRWIAMLLLCAMLAGCGNVYLRGDAKTAVQTSALDAYTAVQRAKDNPATPSDLKAYLDENYRQWRYFVRSDLNDADWGPKLEGE